MSFRLYSHSHPHFAPPYIVRLAPVLHSRSWSRATSRESRGRLCMPWCPLARSRRRHREHAEPLSLEKPRIPLPCRKGCRVDRCTSPNRASSSQPSLKYPAVGAIVLLTCHRYCASSATEFFWPLTGFACTERMHSMRTRGPNALLSRPAPLRSNTSTSLNACRMISGSFLSWQSEEI
jgi:hypothetical protein